MLTSRLAEGVLAPPRRSPSDAIQFGIPPIAETACSVAWTTLSLMVRVLASSEFGLSSSVRRRDSGRAGSSLLDLRNDARRVHRQRRGRSDGGDLDARHRGRCRHQGPARNRCGSGLGLRHGARVFLVLGSIAALLSRGLGLDIVEDHGVLVADELQHFGGGRRGLLGRRLQSGPVTGLILGEEKAADQACQRRRQDVDELGDETPEQRRSAPPDGTLPDDRDLLHGLNPPFDSFSNGWLNFKHVF